MGRKIVIVMLICFATLTSYNSQLNAQESSSNTELSEGLQRVPVGRSSVILNRQNGGSEECNLGNLVAEALFHVAKQRTHVDMAIIPASALQADIVPDEQGLIYLEHVQQAIADSPIVVVTVAAQKLLQLLERSVSTWQNELHQPAFPQIAGFRFAFDPDRPPMLRILTVVSEAGTEIIRNGIPLIPKQTLNVVMPASIANTFAPRNFTNLPYGMQTAVTDYLVSHHSHVPWFQRDTPVTEDGRIRNLRMRSDELSGQFRAPTTGWYWNPDTPGTGVAVETRHGRVHVAWFRYDTDGTPLIFSATLGPHGQQYEGSLTRNNIVVGRVNLAFVPDTRAIRMDTTIANITTSQTLTRFMDNDAAESPDLRDVNGFWHSDQGMFFLETRGDQFFGGWVPHSGDNGWLVCKHRGTGRSILPEHPVDLLWEFYQTGQESGGSQPRIQSSSPGQLHLVDEYTLELVMENATVTLTRTEQPKSPEFIVLSDPHLMAPELIQTYGPALRRYELWDGKLLAASDAIMTEIVDLLIRERNRLDFVLIPGDLTKDGEVASHRRMLHHLAQIEQAGIDVFVVPGNHDLNNPDALRYEENATHPVETLDPLSFAQLYAPHGYAQALSRDTASLSYVAEPAPGLWVFGIDSCRYDENDGREHPVTGGRLRAVTQHWLQEQATQGQAQGKTLIAVMHHGLVEHFSGQSTPGVAEEYVIEDWEHMAAFIRSLGIELVFTGHAHITDITSHDVGREGIIHDIETGSLVTSPGTFRRISVDTNKNTVLITTHSLEHIAYDIGESTLQEYSDAFLDASLNEIMPAMMRGHGVPENRIDGLMPLILAAGKAHHAGDEKPSLRMWWDIFQYMNDPDPSVADIGALLATLWDDLPGHDTNLTINMQH